MTSLVIIKFECHTFEKDSIHSLSPNQSATFYFKTTQLCHFRLVYHQVFASCYLQTQCTKSDHVGHNNLHKYIHIQHVKEISFGKVKRCLPRRRYTSCMFASKELRTFQRLVDHFSTNIFKGKFSLSKIEPTVQIGIDILAIGSRLLSSQSIYKLIKRFLNNY